MSSTSTNSGQNWETILLAEFNKRFAPAKTRDAMQEALDYGFSTMQSATPVRTGNLKSSEGVSVTSDTEGEMHANAEYSGYVNDGTIHQNPQPFFDRGTAAAYQRLKDNCSKL
jgi:HK97 gp10 family phage protein